MGGRQQLAQRPECEFACLRAKFTVDVLHNVERRLKQVCNQGQLNLRSSRRSHLGNKHAARNWTLKGCFLTKFPKQVKISFCYLQPQSPKQQRSGHSGRRPQNLLPRHQQLQNYDHVSRFLLLTRCGELTAAVAGFPGVLAKKKKHWKILVWRRYGALWICEWFGHSAEHHAWIPRQLEEAAWCSLRISCCGARGSFLHSSRTNSSCCGVHCKTLFSRVWARDFYTCGQKHEEAMTRREGASPPPSSRYYFNLKVVLLCAFWCLDSEEVHQIFPQNVARNPQPPIETLQNLTPPPKKKTALSTLKWNPGDLHAKFWVWRDIWTHPRENQANVWSSNLYSGGTPPPEDTMPVSHLKFKVERPLPPKWSVSISGKIYKSGCPPPLPEDNFVGFNNIWFSSRGPCCRRGACLHC